MAFISPKSGKVSQLRQVTIHFSELVTGIDAEDLLLEGQPAEGMEGKNDTWTFSFPPIDYGDAVLTWSPDHKIPHGRPIHLTIQRLVKREGTSL